MQKWHVYNSSSDLGAAIESDCWDSHFVLLNFQTSLFNTEERTKIAEESIAQQKQEISDLMDEMETLQGTVEKLDRQLDETCRMYDEKTEVSEKRFMQRVMKMSCIVCLLI